MSEQIEISADGITIWGIKGPYVVAAFGVALRFRIMDADGNVQWKISVQLRDLPDVDITLSHAEFSTPAKFHEALLRQGFVFKGEKRDLDLLKEAIMEQAQHAEAITYLGWHGAAQSYFFVNGAIDSAGALTVPDDAGILRQGKQVYFLPYTTEGAPPLSKTLARFTHTPGEVTLSQWAATFAAAYGRKGAMPFCFAVSALFRDIGYRANHFAPLLYLRGPRGCGKSSMARNLTAWTGFPQPEISLMSANTVKSLPRLLDQAANALIWFDEYRNDLPNDIRGTLQGVYDGSGYQRASKTNDNQTSSIEVQSSLVLTSNYTPDNEIFLSRCLVVSFSELDKQHTPAQKAAFQQLARWESQGLSSVACDVLRCRALFVEGWKKAYRHLEQYFFKTTENLDTRVINNVAACLAGAFLLEKHGKMPVSAIFGIEPSLEEFGRAVCLEQQRILEGESVLQQFIEVIQFGVDRGVILPDVDYTFLRSRKRQGGLCLAMRLSRLLPYYLKEYRALYNKVGASKAEIEGALRQHPAFLEENSVHFQSPKNKNAPYKSLIFKAEQFSQSFGDLWPHQKIK